MNQNIHNIITALGAGMTADIWYDAEDYGDKASSQVIENTIQAMHDAREVLSSLIGKGRPDQYDLLIVHGDVEPEVLAGPFDYDAVLNMARDQRRRDPSQENGLYFIRRNPLGACEIDAFRGVDLEESQEVSHEPA